MYDFVAVSALALNAFDYLHRQMNYHDQNYHQMYFHVSSDEKMYDECHQMGIGLQNQGKLHKLDKKLN